jgi:hypothetical protein
MLHRDWRRCQVPGCRHADYLDLHRVQPRAERAWLRPNRRYAAFPRGQVPVREQMRRRYRPSEMLRKS